jgi:hypothetical protein
VNDALKLAEAYYAVAADLRSSAQWMLQTATQLEIVADGMCEQSMREQQPISGNATSETGA